MKSSTFTTPDGVRTPANADSAFAAFFGFVFSW